MAAIDEILAGYEALRPDQEAFYQDLHRHPELSHQEHHTAQLLQRDPAAHAGRDPAHRPRRVPGQRLAPRPRVRDRVHLPADRQ